jgi:hypothetical protein
MYHYEVEASDGLIALKQIYEKREFVDNYSINEFMGSKLISTM